MKNKIILLTIILLVPLFSISQNIEKKDGKYYSSDNELYTGIVKQKYDSGELKSRIIVKNGLLHGKSVFYFKNGNKKEVRSYKNGKMHGTWLSYNKEKTKIALANYKKGKKNGVWKIWDNNGTLRFKMEYKMGKKAGTWYNYDENGNLIDTREYNDSKEKIFRHSYVSFPKTGQIIFPYYPLVNQKS